MPSSWTQVTRFTCILSYLLNIGWPFPNFNTLLFYTFFIDAWHSTSQVCVGITYLIMLIQEKWDLSQYPFILSNLCKCNLNTLDFSNFINWVFVFFYVGIKVFVMVLRVINSFKIPIKRGKKCTWFDKWVVYGILLFDSGRCHPLLSINVAGTMLLAIGLSTKYFKYTLIWNTLNLKANK